MAALNLTIDKAPTNPRESANDDLTIVITKQVVVDKTMKFLENSLVDWKEDLSSAQFVIENPQAKAKCGCGTSFSI